MQTQTTPPAISKAALSSAALLPQPLTPARAQPAPVAHQAVVNGTHAVSAAIPSKPAQRFQALLALAARGTAAPPLPVRPPINGAAQAALPSPAVNVLPQAAPTPPPAAPHIAALLVPAAAKITVSPAPQQRAAAKPVVQTRDPGLTAAPILPSTHLIPQPQAAPVNGRGQPHAATPAAKAPAPEARENAASSVNPPAGAPEEIAAQAPPPPSQDPSPRNTNTTVPDQAVPATQAATAPAATPAPEAPSDKGARKDAGATPQAAQGSPDSLAQFAQAAAAPNQPEAAAPAGTAAPALAASKAVAPAHEASGAATPAAPATQVAQAVSAVHIAAGGGGQVTIHLQPAELGAVEVRIERAHDGSAIVTVQVERADTLHALQQDLPHLHQALDRAGVPPQQRELSLHLAPQSVSDSSPGSGAGNGSAGADGQRQGQAPKQGQPASPLQTDDDAATETQPRWQAAGINITA